MFFTNTKISRIVIRTVSPLLVIFVLFSYAYSTLSLFLLLDMKERSISYLYREIYSGQDLYVVSFSLYKSNKSLDYVANRVLDAMERSLREMVGEKYLSYITSGYRVVCRGLINGRLRVAVVVLNITDPLATGLEEGVLYIPPGLFPDNLTKHGLIEVSLIDRNNSVLYSFNTSYISGLNSRLRYLYTYISSSIFKPLVFYVTDNMEIPDGTAIEGIVYIHLVKHIDKEGLALTLSLGNYISMYNMLSKYGGSIYFSNIASPLIDRVHMLLNAYISQFYLSILYIGLIDILVIVATAISIKAISSSKRFRSRLRLLYILGVDRRKIIGYFILIIFLSLVPVGLAVYYGMIYMVLLSKIVSLAINILLCIEFLPLLIILIYSISIVYRSIKGTPTLIKIKPIYIYASVVAITIFISFMLSPLMSIGPILSYIPGVAIDSIKNLVLILLIVELFTGLGSFFIKRLRYVSYPITALLISTGILLSLIVYPLAVHGALRDTLEKNTYRLFPQRIHNIYATDPLEKVNGEIEYYMLSLGIIGINHEYLFLERTSNTIMSFGFGEPSIIGIPIIVSNTSLIFREFLDIEPKTNTIYIYLPLVNLGILMPNLNKLIRYNNTEAKLLLGVEEDYNIKVYSIKAKVIIYDSLPRGIYPSSIILKKLAELDNPVTAPNLLPGFSALFTVAIVYSSVEDFLESIGVKRIEIINGTIKLNCSEIQDFIYKFNVYNYTLLSRNNNSCQIIYYEKYDMLYNYVLYKIIINLPFTQIGGKGIYVDIDNVRNIYVNDILKYLEPSFVVYFVISIIVSIYLVFPIMKTYATKIREYILLYFVLGIGKKRLIRDYLFSSIIHYLLFFVLILAAIIATPSLSAIVLFLGSILYFILLILLLMVTVILASLVFLWITLARVIRIWKK